MGGGPKPRAHADGDRTLPMSAPDRRQLADPTGRLPSPMEVESGRPWADARPQTTGRGWVMPMSDRFPARQGKEGDRLKSIGVADQQGNLEKLRVLKS